MNTAPKPTLGMRHVALNVRDPQVSKKFYVDVLGMQIEWEPDPDNVYLTSHGLDNVALHKAVSSSGSAAQSLDHIGFFVATPEDVAEWETWVKAKGATIVRPLKKHRDGAVSFYFNDPDKITIQLIFHPLLKPRR